MLLGCAPSAFLLEKVDTESRRHNDLFELYIACLKCFYFDLKRSKCFYKTFKTMEICRVKYVEIAIY